MIFDLKYYLSRFLRRLHYFVLLLLCIVAAGAFYALSLPEIYRAEARLLIESPQIPDDLAASTVRADPFEVLGNIQQRILTRTNLLEIAERFDVYQAPEEMSPDEIDLDMNNRIAIFPPNSRDGTGVVVVSFEATDAATSADVTNELIAQIQRQNTEMRTEAAGETLEYFEQEVARLNAELAQQGSLILEFQLNNSNALPESLDFQRNRVSTLQERVLQINRELSSLTDRRSRLTELFEQTGRVDMSEASMSPEQRRLRELQGELASALVIYSPGNPRVTSLRTQVEALEERIEAQTRPDAQGSELQTAYALQISDIDGQISFLSEQREQVEQEIATLLNSINATPENAIELGKLERDYENIRTQFNQATVGLAEARTGDRIEALSKGQRIVLIERATVPEIPSAPNRRLIIAGSIGAGGLAVIGLFLLLEVMNQTIKRPTELTTELGITPFASIPYMVTPGEIIQRRLIVTLGLLVVLVGLPAALYYVHTQIMPLDMLVEEMREQVGA